MNRPYRVLVTGAGAIIGYGIIKSLRNSGYPVYVIAADIFSESYGKYVADAFEQAPYTSAPHYYEWLDEVINQHDVDLVIPGIEQDLFSFNENRDRIATGVVLNNDRIIRLAQDKYETFQFLKQWGQIPFIPTLLNSDYETASAALGIPFIVKPRRSYASKGFYVVKSKSDFDALSNRLQAGDMIFQPYIGSIDDEYTVSVFGTGDGRYADKIILRRYLSPEGATQKAFVVQEDESLQQAVDALVAELKPVGPTNFQFRKSDTIAYLLEINPRISSACSLRTSFGYNEPGYCIDYFLKKQIPVAQLHKIGKAIRFIEDLLIYE